MKALRRNSGAKAVKGRLRRRIYDAVSLGALPGRPERPTAEAMLDDMQHRLMHGRDALADCFHQGLPLLTRMRGEDVFVDPGPPRTPGVDTLVRERPAAEAGPPVVNAFDNRGRNGLLWMTSIPAGDFEPAKTEGDNDWRELCASRLTRAMDFHFEQIEQRLQSLIDDGHADEGWLDQPPSSANERWIKDHYKITQVYPPTGLEHHGPQQAEEAEGIPPVDCGLADMPQADLWDFQGLIYFTADIYGQRAATAAG